MASLNVHWRKFLPVILEFEYTDGTTHVERIPAEIWKMDSETEFPKTVKDDYSFKVQVYERLEGTKKIFRDCRRVFKFY